MIGRELAKALHDHSDNLLDSREVADALSVLLWQMRKADPRATLWASRFCKDDGIIINIASHPEKHLFELKGSVWWIDQTTDPLYAQIVTTADGTAVKSFVIKCGLVPQQMRHKIGDGWYVDEFSRPDLEWFFEFRREDQLD